MKVKFTEKITRQVQELSRRNDKLSAKVEKQLKLFVQQPNHPSLRLHKLKNTSQDTWSLSIDRSIRMLFYYRAENGQQTAVFYDMGTHDEVYRQ